MDRNRWAGIGARFTSALWFLAVGCLLAGLLAVWLAGWRLDRVATTSMEPAIPTGSLAVVRPVNPREVQAGDVVSFRDPGDRGHRVLHRVVKVIDQGPSGLFFTTQGDANVTPDPLFVPSRDVEGALRWHVPRAGRLLWALRPPLGLVVLAGIPTLVLAVGEARRWKRRRSQRVRNPNRAAAA